MAAWHHSGNHPELRHVSRKCCSVVGVSPHPVLPDNPGCAILSEGMTYLECGTLACVLVGRNVLLRNCLTLSEFCQYAQTLRIPPINLPSQRMTQQSVWGCEMGQRERLAGKSCRYVRASSGHIGCERLGGVQQRPCVTTVPHVRFAVAPRTGSIIGYSPTHVNTKYLSTISDVYVDK